MKVVYLHGMGGSSEDWEAVQSVLPGESLSLVNAVNFDRAAAGLAEKFPTEDFLLCGYSMGGRLALRALSLFPRPNLRGLALVSSGFGSSDSIQRQSRLALDEDWARLAASESTKFWQKWYQQDLFSSFQALPEEKKRSWLRRRSTQNINDLSNQLRFLSPSNHGDLLPELERVRSQGISVLYIAGELDKKYSDQARRLAERGIPTEIIPGGHVLPAESPVPLAQTLIRFMGTLPGGKNGKKH